MLKKKLKNIQIYADGANEKEITYFNKLNYISGLTTNPSLMKASGVTNYEKFAKKILKKINKPISFEIFADDEKNIYRQAKIISSWSKKIFVKIPVTNTKKIAMYKVIKKLSDEGVKLNITAIFTKKQIKQVIKSLNKKTPAIISIFCGRIADAGQNPKSFILYAKNTKKNKKKIKILWASTRELYNIIEAIETKCDIITVPTNILNKINIIGKNLEKYSLETVQMFYKDARKAGYKI